MTTRWWNKGFVLGSAGVARSGAQNRLSLVGLPMCSTARIFFLCVDAALASRRGKEPGGRAVANADVPNFGVRLIVH